MTLSIDVIQDFGDGTYLFRLPCKELDELQTITGVGPAELYRRLHVHTWVRRDIRETIRLGLIGHGMDPVKAMRLVKFYVDDRPLLPHRDLAMKLLEAVLEGVAAATAGKTEAAETKNETPAMAPESSTSSQSTETQPP